MSDVIDSTLMHINKREGIRKAREGTKTVKFDLSILLASPHQTHQLWRGI